jgi:hypothetical protein
MPRSRLPTVMAVGTMRRSLSLINEVYQRRSDEFDSAFINLVRTGLAIS